MRVMWKSMKDYQAAKESNWGCEHCGRTFLRETTLVKHLCEQKRRWLDKDRPANRIGYGAWKNFYNTHHPNKKSTEYSDYIKSNYYSAFTKFGSYCVDISAVNPAAYAVWLTKNKVPIDTWATDAAYTRYLVDYIRSEDPFDAIKRTIDALLDIANGENIRIEDIFKYGNKNKLCYLITNGKISPWLLYHSSTGVDFLSRLDNNQTLLVFDYIDPQRWGIKFTREKETVEQVKDVIKKIGL